MRSIDSQSIRKFKEDERCRFRGISSQGRRVVIRLTEKCNLACPHCLVGSAKTSGELTYNQWIGILKELPAINAKKVLLTGGEPLLHPDIVKITEYINQLGIAVDLNSNLQTMDIDLLAELKGAGLTEISVSIEGPGEIHDKMHGKKGAFDKLIKVIDMANNFGITVDASCCLTPQNINCITELLEMIQLLPIQSFTISRLLPFGHGLKSFSDEIEQGQLTKTYNQIKENWVYKSHVPIRMVGLTGLPERKDCQKAKTIIGLKPDGTLQACVLSNYHPLLVNTLSCGLKKAVDQLMESIEIDDFKTCY